MKVEVVPPDPTWQSKFEIESQRVAIALGKNVVTIHHIGSTAIPHICAKPIIDLLAEVKTVAGVDACNSAMAALGYEALGELGISGRRYFRKQDAAGVRTHHVHAFETTSSEVKRHLAFRDYLTAHPETAQVYSELKRQLAHQHPDDIYGYMDGKDDFIKAVDKRAAEWQKV